LEHSDTDFKLDVHVFRDRPDTLTPKIHLAHTGIMNSVLEFTLNPEVPWHRSAI